MSIFKKEMSRKEKIMNGVKNVASTAGAIGAGVIVGIARVAAEAEDNDSYYRGYSHGFDDGFGTTLSGSSYNTSRRTSSGYKTRSTSCLSRAFMKDFIKSFGNLGGRFEESLGFSWLHDSYDDDKAFICYEDDRVRFHKATEGNEWKLYVASYNGIVYMALTSRSDSVIGVASCAESCFEMKFASEEIRNRELIGVHYAVLMTL